MAPRAWLLAMAASLPPMAAQGELVIWGPPAFAAQVRTCLERFSAADPETRAIVATLLQPAPAGERHDLGPAPLGTGAEAHTLAYDAEQSGLQPGGGKGRGSGSNITLNDTLGGAEFCAILLHELKHAADFEDGADRQTQPPLPEPGAGIPHAEIDAMREENRYRRHAGLPQDTDYGGIPLPADAIFN